MLSEAPSTIVEDEAGYEAQAPLRVLRLFGAASSDASVARAFDDGQTGEQSTRPYARAFTYGPDTADLFERATDTIYPNGGDTSLPPVIREGWRTYNFEVEEFHTYIAGGLRVHNTSLLDLIPKDAFDINARDTDGDGKLDTATYNRPGGIEEAIHGKDRDGNGTTDLLDKTRIIPRDDGLLGPGDKVRWQEVYEGNSTVPKDKKIVGIDYAPGTLQGEEVGRTLGSVLGNAIGGNNIFAQVGGATIAATLLQNVGEFLHKGVDLSLLATDGLAVTPLEAAVTDTFKDFGLDLAGNAKIQVINGLSSVLVGEIADALNLQGFERGVFSTVGNTVTNQVLSNVANMIGRPLPNTVVNANVNLLSGFDKVSMASNLANSLGGYFGSQLGTLLITPNNQQAALFGSAAAAVGSYVGGALAGAGAATLATAFSIVPVIGTLIGAFAGQVLGNLMGNALFDDDRVAHYKLYTDPNGVVQYGYPYTQDGANLKLSEYIASTTAQAINSVYGNADARIDIHHAFNPFTVGWYVDTFNQKIMYSVNTRYSAPYNIENTRDIISLAVNYAVANSEMSGSDLILRRAYQVSHDDGLAQLGFDLQVAKDFKKYEANTALINTLIAEAPGSEFAAGWIATLQRAKELGLHKTVDFNAMEYLASQGDLRQVFGTDTQAATRHFINFGIDEGRTSTFDALEYLAANPGLAQALNSTDRNTAADHYIRFGQAEGRQTHFDYLAYLAANPGLAQALGGFSKTTAELHYINYGYSEARPIQGFDVLHYLASNPGLAQQIGGINSAATQRHYIVDGYRGGWPTKSFDYMQYLAANPGLAQQIGGIDAASAQRHYITYGYSEGRPTRFDSYAYLASHSDLARAFGLDRAAVDRHVVDHGFRGITFDPSGYLDLNPDVRAAFGYDLGAAARHYIQTGRYDGVHGGSFIGRASGLTIEGGAGFDRVNYEASSKGVIINLKGPQSYNGMISDTLVSIEVIVGSAFADQITGDDTSNILYGQGGDDTLYGLGGNDTLYGGSGDDKLYGGAGADVLSGDAGYDYARYDAAAAGVTVSLSAPASNTGEAAGDTFVGIEGLVGSAFDDQITGDSTSNTLYGGRGSDTLFGGSGDDKLYGGDGADDLYGGAGADTLSGDAGYDFARYDDVAAGVIVSLSAPASNAGEAAGDTFVGIEGIYGSAFDDQITGDSTSNTLYGGRGNDRIYGGGGDDKLYGGAGADVLSGDAGYDFARYDYASGGVTVSLSAPTSNTGEAAGDTFVGIEAIYGSGFADRITGDDTSNTLYGQRGNDTLYGLGGLDSLYGGDGDDHLYGGAGADTLSGDAGYDFARYDAATAGIAVSLSAPSSNTGEAAGDTFVGIEGLYGSAFDDQITGDSTSNTLYGLGGNDSLFGRDGDDHLHGGAGADALSGDAGYDFARYDGAAAGVTVSLSAPASNTGEAAGDTFVGIEGIYGSAFDDRITGDDTSNTLYGGSGSDTLYGQSGNDTLFGGSGDDHLYGGTGADALSGDAGYDYARYDAATAGITVSLSAPASNTGEAAGDTFIGIEGVYGSAFDDQITGDDTSNTLYGGSGNDTLFGASGVDKLYGGSGDDHLQGGVGADVLSGDAGYDFARYDDAAAGVTVSLSAPASNTGEAAGDTFVGIEGLVGSAFDDQITGDSTSNTFYGQGGNDTLYGLGGIDSLFGGDGDDHLHGGVGADTLIGDAGYDYARYDAATAGIIVSLSAPASNTGEAAGDTFVGIEGLVGSAFDDRITGDETSNTLYGQGGNDTLYGLGGLNSLFGGDGDDHLYGGAGADTLTGDAGYDFARYDDASGGVTVSLSAPASNTGEAAGDTLVSIEAIYGSAFDDQITGDDTSNTLYGQRGNDTLYGLGGLDSLYGGDGDDHLHGGAGADVLSGEAGYDFARYDDAAAGVTVSLSAPASNTGEAAGDTFVGIEGIYGSAFDDQITGDSTSNTLYGLGGNDSLFGGDGDDHLHGGAGADTLSGDAGYDFARYDYASGGVTVSLSAPASNTGEAAGDTFVGIEGIYGSAFDDQITGDETSNVLYGQRGNDTLFGGGGDDKLYGGDGADDLYGGAGADALSGDAGYDFARYDAAAAGVIVSLSAPESNAGEAAGDTFVSIEGIYGSAFDDQITGDGTSNILYGLRGNDSLFGGGGDDHLYGGAGADTLSGDAGYDYARYDYASGGVTVSLSAPASNTGDAAGDTLVSIEAIYGSGFADRITGDDTGNTLYGQRGNDTLYGLGGLDSLFGGDGDDHLYGGAGADALSGDAGYDFARYDDAAAGVIVSLSAPESNAGEAAGDTLVGIEGIYGSTFDDQITGDDTSNILYGQGGNDSLFGLGGDDTLYGGSGGDKLYGGDGADDLYGGAGADTLSGDAGYDYARYDDASGGVTVSLSAPSSNTGEAAGDTFVGIEGIYGSAFDDQITGDDTSNILYGLRGNDTLFGGSGDDKLYGGDGADDLYGGAGADTLSGEAGYDFARYDAATAGITVSLSAPASNAGEAAGDTFVGIEGIYGSAFDDQITGDGTSNILYGQRGNDSLFGGDGDDKLYGGAGADALFGDAGYDYARYDYASGGVTVSLSAPASNTGDAAGDTLVSIEAIYGSGFADRITGDDDGNTLYGQRGNDTLYGLGGLDSLFGGDGDDQLYGGAGADVLSGDAGYDFARYDAAAGGVIVSLSAPSSNTGEAAGDTFVGIEGVYGSAFDDQITGDDTSNILYGQGGNDSLFGGDGDDHLHGGAGADVLSGDAGYDFARYDAAAGGITVSLSAPASNTGEAAGDTFVGIEGFYGSAFDDRITGDSTSNILYGQRGNDTLFGGSGDDKLYGGDGADDLYGGAGADTLSGDAGYDFARYDAAAGGVIVSLSAPSSNAGEAAGDTFVGIEGIYGSAFDDQITGDGASNILYGGRGNDRIYGGGGDDHLYGGAGADALSGDAGYDYARYDYASGGVTVSLSAPASNTGEAAGDTFVGIEAIYGSGFADRITGDDTGNTLYGQGGNDALYGGSGDDKLYGGAGADALSGGDGSDTFFFQAGSGNDTVTDFMATLGSGVHDTILIASNVNGSGIVDFGSAVAHATQVGSSVNIDLGAGNLIILQNVTLGSLAASDFAFV